MKILRGLLLAFLFGLAAPTFAQKPAAPDFKDTLRKATIAVYHGKQRCEDVTVDTWLGPFKEWGCKFERQFTCTATIIDRPSETTYVGLSAGHCFDWSKKDEYFVTDKIAEKPVLHHIVLLKFENDDRYDYGVFIFNALEEFPTIQVDLDSPKSPEVGTTVLNVNYSYGLAKQTLEGKVVSDQIEDTGRGTGAMKGRYLVTIGVGPGASGSAIVDSESHKIVGLVEGIFPGTQMPTVVVPTGATFKNFGEDDSAGIAPQAKPKESDAPTMKHGVWEAIIKWLNKIL